MAVTEEISGDHSAWQRTGEMEIAWPSDGAFRLEIPPKLIPVTPAPAAAPIQ
jgi:hypothetical protein